MFEGLGVVPPPKKKMNNNNRSIVPAQQQLSTSSTSMGLTPLPPALRNSSTSSIFGKSVDFSSILTPSFDAIVSSAFKSEDFKLTIPYPTTTPKEEEEETTNNNNHHPPQPPSSDIVSTIEAFAEKNKAEERERKQKQKAQRNKNNKTSRTRRFKEPIIKEYVDVPSDRDVLLGRGGKSNHHPGNKAYRDQVGTIRDSYRTSEKNEKTVSSQMLVDWVHQRGGRFLKQEDDESKRWYVVTNIVARRKSSQALREHMTKEEREEMKRRGK